MPGQPWIVSKKKLQQLEIPKIIKKTEKKMIYRIYTILETLFYHVLYLFLFPKYTCWFPIANGSCEVSLLPSRPDGDGTYGFGPEKKVIDFVISPVNLKCCRKPQNIAAHISHEIPAISYPQKNTDTTT